MSVAVAIAGAVVAVASPADYLVSMVFGLGLFVTAPRSLWRRLRAFRAP